jgi:hypothetical protein
MHGLFSDILTNQPLKKMIWLLCDEISPLCGLAVDYKELCLQIRSKEEANICELQLHVL